MTLHFKCRGGLYPRSNIERYGVPDDKVSWSSEYEDYKPPNHTASSVHGKPWADSNIGEPGFKPLWNSVDGKVNRVSYMGKYAIQNGFPLNPIGRTGISGRGVLGRWGPNHAADPVVTRWKRLESGEIENDGSSKPILQFVAIKRRDTGEWALPGGMVDPGEKMSATAVREFQEEATNSLLMDEEEKEAWMEKFKNFFNDGDVVYKGYIDDPRNTDNAWMESIAYNFHDNSGSTVGALKLHAGDDAVGVRWVDITPDIKLYASHKDIVMEVMNKHLTNLSK
ncbi:ADP-ribose pyrophosphatase, mitochondrial [Trichoplusia ni]|uniref:ADP-ribose pyrophosphatase, mitochondrial n=1 Tax=Trichoplusia ni TaxID=7111 RepID=A0A7E5W364_TRINI|nr:ADP-ribose pyrophosphatase, mitochondrial [Trichoplusia ni]